ncbi:MAG: hypothetical protein HZA25_00010 [Candidatus Niyogibacteria bacterium]|nr:hypothetical protein [Candidatus Niyogibacteria bacterium]
MSNCDKENSISHFAYISDRARRITEALYRVTDLFSDEEPVKWLLRNDAVKIFSRLSALEDNVLSARVKDIEGVSQVIGRILQSLELASSGAFISHINFEVLKREYSALKEFIGANTAVLLPQPQVDLKDALSAPVFAIGTADKPQITSPYQPIVERSGASEESVKILNKNAKDAAVKSEAFFEEQGLSEKTVSGSENVKDIPVKKIATPVSSVMVREVKKNADLGAIDGENEARLARQKKIMDFVKNNGWVGVGDVSVVFAKSISEKTIQRELMAMADAGILRKAGDKRWRRYACI